MNKLKGFKTFIAAGLTILLGMLGKHLAPDVIADYADVIIAGLGLAFAALRIVSTTPVFQQFEAVISRDLGLSPGVLAQISSQIQVGLDPDDKASINQAASNLNDAVDKITGHPLLQPATADVLSQLSQNIPALISALSPARAAVELAKATPEPELAPTFNPALAPAAVVQQ